VSILRHRAALLGDTVYTRTPIKVLKAIPAGFPLALHDDYFGVAGHSDAIFSNIMTNGEDLRAFTDLAMTSEIPLEIIDITPGSNLIHAYVRIPSALSINDKIYLRTTVGGGETAPTASSTNGSEAVWSDYEIVAHGNDLTIDVTGNNAAGTNVGGVSETGASLLNGWPAFGYGANEGTASTDKVNIVTPNATVIASETAIFYKNGTEGNTLGRIVQWEGIDWQLIKSTTDEIVWRRKASTTHQSLTTTTNLLTDDAWHGVMATWPAIGTAPTFRHNGGSMTGTIVNGTGTYTDPSQDIYFGNNPGGTIPGDIRMAEYRLRPDNTPSTAFQDLEWDGFNDPGSVAEAEALVVV